jgi:hypothetical protein
MYIRHDPPQERSGATMWSKAAHAASSLNKAGQNWLGMRKKGDGKRTAGDDSDPSSQPAASAAPVVHTTTSYSARPAVPRLDIPPRDVLSPTSTQSESPLTMFSPRVGVSSRVLSPSGSRAESTHSLSALTSPRDGQPLGSMLSLQAAGQRQLMGRLPPISPRHLAPSARSETPVAAAKPESRPPSVIRAASPAGPPSPRTPGTSAFKAVVSPSAALAISSPRAQSPAAWPQHAGQVQMQKDSALNPAQAAILTLSIGPTLTIDALERFQCAGMKHFEQMGIMSIVDDERMPSRAMATRSLFCTVLNDPATFHIDKCVRMEGESVDWADFMQMPIPFIGPLMLLKGHNPRLDALRNGIYRFRKIQNLVKTRVHEPGLSEEANRKISNDILREPMRELAAFAGYKYGMLLFVSPPGELWATGMCKPRYQEVLKWLDAIESRVKRSIKAYDDKNAALAAVQMLNAPADMATESDTQCNVRMDALFIDEDMAA